MTTITITIATGDDDYEVKLIPKPKPKATDEWDVDTALAYFAKLQPHIIVTFNALLDEDRTTTYLTKLVDFSDTSVFAGSLAWPGRFASEMGKKLPWSYDGHTVKLLPEVKPIFREAIERFVGK